MRLGFGPLLALVTLSQAILSESRTLLFRPDLTCSLLERGILS